MRKSIYEIAATPAVAYLNLVRQHACNKIMNAAAEMASQFARYGDMIVGFVVIQGVAFAYGLGKEGTLKRAILSGYAFVMWILFFAAAFYLGLVSMCGYWEHSLRSVAGQTGVVLRASIAATTGRSIMVLVCMLICGFALHRNKPKSTHGAAG